MLNPCLLGTLLPREVWLLAQAARAGKVPLQLPQNVLLGETVRVVQDIHSHAFFPIILITEAIESDVGFPGGPDGKESACNVGVPGFDPWLGKIPWSRA